MTRALRGRADLLRLLHHDSRMRSLMRSTARDRAIENVELEYIADLFGVEWVPIRQEIREEFAGSSDTTSPQKPEPIEPTVVETPREHRYLRVIAHRTLGPLKLPENVAPAGEWRKEVAPTPEMKPLCAWPVLAPRLRRGLQCLDAGKTLDVERAVEDVARGRTPRRFVTLPVRRWGAEVQLIRDSSTRLAPYDADWDFFETRLRRLVPAAAFEVAGATHPFADIQTIVDDAIPTPWRKPCLGAVVVVLSDLGLLDRRNVSLPDAWLRWGAMLVGSGCRLVAVVPCSETMVPASFRRLFHVVPWQRNRSTAAAPSDETRESMLNDILIRLAPATRVEPGLLRDIRLELGFEDVSLESEIWQCDAIRSPHPTAATPAEEVVNRRYLPEFEAIEDPAKKQASLALLKKWHAAAAPEVWLTEVSRLSAETAELLSQEDRTRRDDFVRYMLDNGTGSSRDSASLRTYSRFACRCLTTDSAPKQDPELARRLESYIASINDRSQDPNSSGDAVYYEFFQVGENVQFRRDGRPPLDLELQTGIPLCRIAVGSGKVWIDEEVSTNGNAFWKSGEPPHWAREWGWDQYGAWTKIRFEKDGVAPVEQKLRWIPPGDFLMGSPESEQGRDNVEGPQHRVVISRGFWLFDTPVTEACWQLVMGAIPNAPTGSRLPVHGVNFFNCRDFFTQALEGAQKFPLVLPTEAQWEYACRAGTTTRYSWGDDIGPQNARYEQPEGMAEVGSFPPNPFGLFDMHGNVEEWCQDGMRKYSSKLSVDPVGSGDEFAPRVIRGGSWIHLAGYLRSACRIAYAPVGCDNTIGFRCAIVVDAAEPAAADPSRRAEPKANPKPTGAAQEIALSGNAVAEVPIPDAPRVVVRSDVDEVTIEQMVRPSWALAVGRDKYGLWADFEVPIAKKTQTTWWRRLFGGRGEPEIDSAAPIRQRVRWIPPGRFQMGPSKSEVDRFGDRGLQNEVRLTRGYWLFDTPCRQSLYAAMVGSNPSRFQDADRPIEMVSWQEANDFCLKLSGILSGVDVRLPTEAEWEYACRAGSSTAIYTGDLKIIGENDAPALDLIAWYGGNSGREFDLQSGFDSASWPSKQYDHAKAGTRRVGQKSPNRWGLFDMLGNVWEWCLDRKRKYNDELLTSPQRVEVAATLRFVRGGSWHNGAQFVRSAMRVAYIPVHRGNDLGFRCALN